MCGIAGILHIDESTPHKELPLQLDRALQKMIHRGPDAKQIAEVQRGWLGHVRLSIIDTSADAHQPFWDATHRYAIVFNGEIFNFQELKKKLKKTDWKTTSDTELLLYYLIEFGEQGIQDLNGFFAFCLYDTHTNDFLLARDRMGEKPLYYAIHQNKLHFASELKPLLQFDLPRAMDMDVCGHFLQFGYTPPARSVLQGILKLERRCFIRFRAGQLSQGIWPIDEALVNMQEPISQFRTLFSRAVERRLMTDVPLCTFLSGGVDSSIVAFEASQYQPSIPAFSLRFSHSPYLDESERAKRFASSIGIAHTTVTVDEAQLPRRYEEMLDLMDEPFGDSSALALYSLTQALGTAYKVSLSGDGGDELLGGYRKHLAWMKAQEKTLQNTLIKTLPLGLISDALIGREHPYSDRLRKLKKYHQLLHTPAKEQYTFLRQFVSWEWIAGILPQAKPIQDDVHPSTLNAFLAGDQAWVLQTDMLTKTDRCGMWSSMEIRSPFMDPSVVDFCNQLPSSHKMAGLYQKVILRNAYKDALPEWLFDGAKKGFEIPLVALIDALSKKREGRAMDASDVLSKSMTQLAMRTHTPVSLRYNLIVLLDWMERNALKFESFTDSIGD
jgi:asparagine synthase (glutamine-hydrolysing)